MTRVFTPFVPEYICQAMSQYTRFADMYDCQGNTQDVSLFVAVTNLMFV